MRKPRELLNTLGALKNLKNLNPILHRLLEIRYHMGGIILIPPIKIHQNDSNLVKIHVLAKIDYCCPLFMHLELNHYHFWPQKGPKNQCIFTRIEGFPLWIVSGKIVNVKFFGNFKKKPKKWPTQDLSNIERNKVIRISPLFHEDWCTIINQGESIWSPPPM